MVPSQGLASPSMDIVVYSVGSRTARGRAVGTGERVSLRVPNLRDLLPGEIASVHVEERRQTGKTLYLSGFVIEQWLDVVALELVPLRLEPRDIWDPAEEYWGEDGEPLPDWAAPIIQAGQRAAFEMEQVIPGVDWDDIDDDPIVEAAELTSTGYPADARRLLMNLLARDLRCLDAYAHLGNICFARAPDAALRHYQVGIRIDELTLGPDFDDVLPWSWVDNRPFLRCLHGYGLCLWRLGHGAEAAAVVERLLWLNPSDNQGARVVWEDLRRGRRWDEVQEQ
jgi:tetratricopeptide (TPR) repeat protein